MINYEKKYKEAIERAKKWRNAPNIDKMPTYGNRIIEEIFPELKESEDERVRKALIDFFSKGAENGEMTNNIADKDIIAWLEKQKRLTTEEYDQGKADVQWCIKQAKKYAKDENEMGTCWFAEIWLEKQGEIDKTSYEIAEKEKREFVGDGFIQCHADFQDFKEGETYWLEYVGNDNYNVRSDNLLHKTYHITPLQLYTIFKKLTWVEKQDEKTQGKTAIEAIKEEKVDNANKVEPKFKIGDWITIKQ